MDTLRIRSIQIPGNKYLLLLPCCCPFYTWKKLHECEVIALEKIFFNLPDVTSKIRASENQADDDNDNPLQFESEESSEQKTCLQIQFQFVLNK